MLRTVRPLLLAKVNTFMPYVPVVTNTVVYMDLAVEGDHAGRVVIELFSDTVPKSTENVRSLCTGERPKAKCVLHYKGIPFHRIIPQFIMQGGDVFCKDGRGNESVFGYPFPSESFAGKAGENRCGTIALAHHGPNQNGSQFFFNLARNSHLDGKFVVVGQVVDGWDVIAQVAKACGSRCGTPVSRSWISDCGQSGGVEMEDLARLADSERTPELLPGREVLNSLRPR